VRHISKRIAIMYLGQIVEMADTDTIFENTMHPYSIALLSAIPIVDVERKVTRIILKGDVPSPIDPPPGCCFHTRCPYAAEVCRAQKPELRGMGARHRVACHFAEPPNTPPPNG
jgi:oligopeptide/dipeptide ABC transporter ATP-binding protein